VSADLLERVRAIVADCRDDDELIRELEAVGLTFGRSRTDQAALERLIVQRYRPDVLDLRAWKIPETAKMLAVQNNWSESYAKKIADGSRNADAGKRLYDEIKEDRTAADELHDEIIKRALPT
jgi:hypothetical protein